MKAMILAAGRGERMRPLTDTTPKPLLEVGGGPLIAHHLRALAAAGVREVVINLSWQGARIRDALADGRSFGLHIAYSDEGDDVLETGGGIFRALPLLGADPFLVINGDVWTRLDYRELSTSGLRPSDTARLVLVPRPPWRRAGDFAVSGTRLRNRGAPMWTFAGIGVYSPAFFAGCSGGRFPLAPLLRAAADADCAAVRIFGGDWEDVGTPDRLRELRRRLTNAAG